ncbi:uncharacterized protein VTP21DRAFT_232 [Calcarisporiella thermophila]|uniref:uncharacterized protein n=1 Tax=Calcarisporiella thermophila TaxID=911321 RepID=UPI0037425547
MRDIGSYFPSPIGNRLWLGALILAPMFAYVMYHRIQGQPPSSDRKKKLTQHDVPGPIVDPGQGSLPDIAVAGGLIPFVRSLHSNYGPIARFYLTPGEPVISVADSEIIKKSGLLQAGSRPKDMFAFLTPLIGSDNLQIYDAKRADLARRRFAPALSHQVISTKYRDILDIIHSLFDRWDRQIEKGQDIIAMQTELMWFGLMAIVKTALSVDLGNYDMQKFKSAYDASMSGLFDKQFGNLGTYSQEEIDTSLAFLHQTIHSLVEDRRNTRAAQSKGQTTDRDLFDILLTETDPTTGEPFSEEMISSHFSVFILAGYHTTAISIAWAIFALTQHPEMEQRLYEEVSSVLGDRVPQLSDFDKMPFLNNFIKETLRVHTIGPFASRQLDAPTLIGEYEVDAGTTIFLPICVIHSSEAEWGPDAAKFNPDRFAKGLKPPISYCPFGLGARICPGDRLAMVEIRAVIACLVQRYKFELAMPPEEVVPMERFVAMAKNDIHVRLCRRS